MISADAFGFTYPTESAPALDDISFHVDAGEVLGVVGPVEAGKTTLAMALAGFAPQNTGGTTRGTLSVAGRDPRQANDNAVAMVFEDYAAQLTQVRVIDEVVAPLVNRGQSRSQAVPRARELLEHVRLAEAAEKFTWDLSGGEQQRLALAAALAVDPEVLIFDTATDMLDPEGRETVANLIASLAGQETLVVTANDPDELVGIADTVLVLDDGERVASGPADDLLRDRELLRTVGVGAPLCVDVARRIGLDADPLTPREFAECLSPRPEPVETGRRTSADGGTRLDEDEDAENEVDANEENEASPVNTDVDDVKYAYADGTVAVDGVNLDVYDGEVHAVIGGNGAGKSTFGKLLVGLLNPDDGHVRVTGTDTHEVSARELGTSIGIALQNPDEQLSEPTVEAELRFPLERRQYERVGLLSLSKEKRYDDQYIDDRVEEVCELVGIDDAIREEDPIFLSRGQRRLVTLALAVAPDPDAVVLDEPTAGLDATARTTVKNVVERLERAGKAVVLVDHDLDFVCEVADRITVLSDGEIVLQGPPGAVFARENWDRLADHHLRTPRVARLARKLGLDAHTVDGLVEELSVALEGPA